MVKTQVGRCAIALILVFTTIFILEKLFKDDQKKRVGYRLMLGAYCGTVLWITLLSRQPMSERTALLIPFESVSAAHQGYLQNRAAAEIDGGVTAIEDIRCFLYAYNWLILNVMLFVPYGILSSRVFQRINFLTFFSYGIIGTIGIEMIQYVFRLGCLDIDDIIHNLIGIGVGYMMSKLLQIRKRYISLKQNTNMENWDG